VAPAQTPNGELKRLVHFGRGSVLLLVVHGIRVFDSGKGSLDFVSLEGFRDSVSNIVETE
jgi:hypothetical protein